MLDDDIIENIKRKGGGQGSSDSDISKTGGRRESDSREAEVLENFIIRIVRSHQAILSALSLIDLKDAVYLIKGSEILDFLKKREKRLRELVRELRTINSAESALRVHDSANMSS